MVTDRTGIYLDTGLKAELKAFAAINRISMSEAVKRAVLQMLADAKRYAE